MQHDPPTHKPSPSRSFLKNAFRRQRRIWISMHELSKNTYLSISRIDEGMTSVGMIAYEKNIGEKYNKTIGVLEQASSSLENGYCTCCAIVHARAT